MTYLTKKDHRIDVKKYFAMDKIRAVDLVNDSRDLFCNFLYQ
jgi:hypothetical protein